jgi:DNA-binding transcriptional ArsR family regulator
MKVKIELSEEWKNEMKKLREEIADLKEQLSELSERAQEKREGIHIDVGERVHDYVESMVESVAEGISGELEKSVLIGPGGTIRVEHRRGKEPAQGETKVDPAKASVAMSALGNEHRLKILEQLVSGGKYISELQEKLLDITASTLSSHLDVLQEAGLVVQEKVRGRYLITMPGRMAYNMANQIAKLVEKESV